MNFARRAPSVLLALAVLVLCPAVSFPATYMPMSDVDLVRLAPIVVHAEVVDRTIRIDRDGEDDLPFTVVTLLRLEQFKGEVGETFRLVVPGGIAEGIAWAVSGAPLFEEGQEVLLMLNPLQGRPGEYGLSEFGLSKFDLASDERGRRFAVRPVFAADEDLVLSKREPHLLALAAAGAVPARDAESFLSALRGVALQAPLSEIAYAVPAGELEPLRRGRREKFANLGGVELGNCNGEPCLFRWFWDTGGSPSATVFLTGTQSSLVSNFSSCGTDQACLADYVADQWHGVAGTDIRISGPTMTGNLEVLLDRDAPHNGTAWSTPYDCTNGGAVGIGGPTSQGGAQTFKGLTPYYACGTGKVSMRRWTCAYQTSAFIEILMHEIGHVLGLHHPNQHQSVHSQTTSAQWADAVMTSQAHTPSKTVPQADDIQAMQFYYGTAAPGPAPAANFTFPGSRVAGAPVSFTDTTTNSPTGWIWFFGEPSSGGNNVSRSRNPSHTYAAPGTYTVDLIAGNLNGGSRVTKQVAVTAGASACVPNATTLCLNNNRFRVTAAWRKNDGTTGNGTGVELTADSGYFWFFSSANIEAVVKVLNACGLNPPRYWVFAAGLTNVEVSLNVTDTQNGTLKPYTNPLNTAFQPIQDTNAFATCP